MLQRAEPFVERAGLLTAIVSLALALASPAAAQEPLRIGLSLPLSGNAAILGQQFRNGARFAVEELAQGRPVELVFADDGCDEELAKLAATDLKNAGIAFAGGMLCNDAARAVAEAFAGTPIPVLASDARSEQLMRDADRNDWSLFRMAPGDDAAAAAAAESLSQRWSGQPWAILDDGTVYGRTLADSLRGLMEEKGMPPVFADSFRPAQSTQASVIRRLQRAGVSAAFAAGAAEDVAIIWGNVLEAGAKIEVAGGEALSALPWTEAARTVEDGLLAVLEQDPAPPPAQSSLAARLVGAGVEPEPFVFLGYAAIELALAAVQPTPEETLAALRDRRFETVVGAFDFDETGRNVIGRYGLYEWRGDRFVTAGVGAR